MAVAVAKTKITSVETAIKVIVPQEKVCVSLLELQIYLKTL